MQTHSPALLSECGSSYRRRFSLWILLTLFVLAAGQLAYAADTIKVPMTNDGWTVTAGTVDFAEYMGRPAISLKAGNFAKHIPTGAAVLKSVNFHNGTIEYDVIASGGMGAGFVFRRSDKDNYEMFYLRPRPKCEDAPDCIQYAPETKGALLWDVFPQYQGPAPLQQEGWNHVKLVVNGKRMNIFINGASTPTLKIGRLEGDADQGSIMIEGPGIFSNITVTPDATEGLTAEPEKDDTDADNRYVRHWQLSSLSKLEANTAPAYAGMPAVSAKWMPIDAERDGFINASRVYGVPADRPARSVVWLKTTIHSSKAQTKHLSFGWLREAFVYVNGDLVFADKNLYMQAASARKAPDGRLSLQNGGLTLPLKEGDNEVAIAIVNDFYGWGIKMRLDDMDNVTLATR